MASGRRDASTLQLWLVAAGVAAALVGSQWAIVRLYGGFAAASATTISSVMPLVLLLSAPMLLLLALSLVRMPAVSERAALLAVALVGVAMRWAYVGAPALMEDDHHRYLLDGALLAHGFNPYAAAPAGLDAAAASSPRLAAVIEAGRDTIATINFPDLRSMYPGAAQLLFAVAHLVAPWSLDGLRLAMALAEFATFLLLAAMLPRLGLSPLWAGLIWCNPLLAFTLTGQAHVDAVLAPLVIGALWLGLQRRPVLAGLALGLAVGVKFWPVLLAPLLARALGFERRRLTPAAMAFGATAALLCAPVLASAMAPSSGLSAYAAGWTVNNAPFAWASWGLFLWLGPGVGEVVLRGALAGLLGAAALAVAWRPVASKADAIRRALMVTALLFYCAPAQFPWYAAWFLPFAALAGSRSLLLAAATLPIYYLFFPLAAAGERDLHNYGLALLHVAPVAAAWIVSRRPASRAST
jgi:hypothetical protein